MYLNLCNAKFSIIDVENRVYGEVILSLHFSIPFFNMNCVRECMDVFYLALCVIVILLCMHAPGVVFVVVIAMPILVLFDNQPCARM